MSVEDLKQEDQELVAFRAEQQFKRQIAERTASDVGFATLKEKGFIDKAINDFPEAKGNLDLLAKLALKTLKAEEALSQKAQPPKEEPKQEIKPEVKPEIKLPENPQGSASASGKDDIVDFNNIDFNKLDKVSDANKLALKMVSDPAVYRVRQYRGG